jgi:hypothetical protein
VAGLVIGWGIWPVQWKNSLPQDLRPAERNAYLSMVAESYAVNGDLQLAEERLVSWPRAELATAMADLQEALINTNAKLAGDVQALALAMNLGSALPQPAGVSGQPAGQSLVGSPQFKTICTSALWVLLVLVGLAGAAYLFTRWRAARNRQTGPAIGGAPGRGVYTSERLPSDVSAEAQSQSSSSGREGAEDAELTSASGHAPADQGEPQFYEVEPGGGDTLSAGVRAPEEARRPAAKPAMPEAISHTPAAASGQVPSLAKLVDELAIYQMGEPDYDEAFDINDSSAGYMGECGLQSNDLVGRDRDLAVALRVWLYDQRDSSTQLKVLMSEGAYRDTALRSQQAGGHEVLQVRPGLEFELESHDLLLRGRVEKVDYTDQEPYRGVFAELQVKMQVYRKS